MLVMLPVAQLLLLLLSFSHDTASFRPVQWKIHQNKCRSLHRVENYEIAAVMAGMIPASSIGQCFQGCMMERVKWIENGRFVKENALRFAEERLVNNHGHLERARTALSGCALSVREKGSCSLGPAIVKCVWSRCSGGLPLPLLGPNASVVGITTSTMAPQPITTASTVRVTTIPISVPPKSPPPPPPPKPSVSPPATPPPQSSPPPPPPPPPPPRQPQPPTSATQRSTLPWPRTHMGSCNCK